MDTDPQMRKLAKSIIASQDKEIKEMQEWLNVHGQSTESPPDPTHI
ncbi:DUF305 domain-containing protein [Salmonella enterica subsp. enterica serovar Kiambu]|nr:DUF305 domain-containing protein [Citrobacter braakii]